MAQMTYALLYGIEHPEGVDLFGEDGGSGLLGTWVESCRRQIDAFDASRKDKSLRTMGGHAEFVPVDPYQSTVALLGFYVAVGASGKPGIPQLEGFALDDVALRYGEAMASARARWNRFAAWCNEQGHELPAAKLYLTETEVG